MQHSDYIQSSRVQLKAILNDMLSANTDLLAGIRAVNSFRFEIDAPEPNFFNSFVSFDSETDHFPVGVTRTNYSTAALERVDREISEYISETREEILNEARCLLKKLETL